MRATWYVLEGGAPADPAECAPDDKGVLRHKSGKAVAMRGDAYSSTGVDLEEVKKAAEPKDPVASRVTKPAPSKSFKTR